MTALEVIQAVSPYLLPVLTAYLGYFFGRRTVKDKIRYERGFEVGEKVSSLFIDVANLESYLYKFYEINFAKRGDGYTASFDEAIESLEKLDAMYHEQYSQIEEVVEKRAQLLEAINDSHLYLDHKILGKMEEYYMLGLFPYTSDGGIMTNTWLRGFFRNLIATEKHIRRMDLRRNIKKDLRRLVK